jgi:TolB-like protein
MKKIVFVLLSCLAAAGVSAQNISLDAAITTAALEMSRRLPPQSKAAVLSFTSPSDQLSRYVIEELNNAIVNEGKLVVVDRQQLDLIMQEMQFQLSGMVSDESAQAIGRMLGAQYIVSGSMELIAGAYRFRTRALAVETAAIVYSDSRNVTNDRTITSLTTGGGVTGDFTAAERDRARWLNILWGAGSFSQRDILGGSITGLLDVGGLVCIGIGVVALVTLDSPLPKGISSGGIGYIGYEWNGETYRSWDDANNARDEWITKHEIVDVILISAGGVLSTAGLIYGFLRPSFAHRPGYVAGGFADPANWNIALVSGNSGDPALRLTYKMSF